MSSKAEEAQKHIQEAEKNLKSGFFKKPEYDLASYEFAKAAVCFKNARQFDKAIDAYLKAKDCCLKTNNQFQAAKHLSEASLICKDARQFEQSADLAEQSGALYLESRANDTAAIALERSAHALEADVPDRAVRLYEAAARAHEVDEKLRDVGNALGNAARLLVKQRRLDAAFETLKRRSGAALRAQDANTFGRTVMYAVLTLLAREGDSDSFVGEARKYFNEACSRCEPLCQMEDGAATDRLLQALEVGDAAMLANALRLPAVRNAENEYVKLTRLLKINELSAALHRQDQRAEAELPATVTILTSKWDVPVASGANSSQPAAQTGADEQTVQSSSKFTDDDFEGGLA